MDRDFDVILAKKGNKEAFTRLIKSSESSMYRVAQSFFKSDNDCADSIQDTILKAYKMIGLLKEPKYFKTWLIRILINECKRSFNLKKKVIPMEELTKGSVHEELLDGYEVREAVNSLEDDLRIIVTLYYFEDLSLKEIGQVLEIPKGTIKSRLSRARAKLAYLLGDETARRNSHG